MTGEPWKPRRVHRRNIYYKVQVFDSTSIAWRDEKPQFGTIDDAEAFIVEKSLNERVWRIMSVEGRTRVPVRSATDRE